MSDPAVERLRRLIRIPTVSSAGEEVFAEFRRALAELYPVVHARLELVRLGGALLYRWPGEADGAPTVLMAHQDVVPVADQAWRRDPFSGDLDGDRVHGRGALDDKGALVSILEAVEGLLAEGFRPEADVYLSFGSDEEVAGHTATDAVLWFEQHGVRPGLVVDEGGAVVEGVFPGVSRPLAMVGVSEKGMAGVRLRVVQRGGHASTPGGDVATVRLARAIARLDRSPARAFLGEPTRAMLRAIAPHAAGLIGVVLRTPLRGLLAPLFARLGNETAAMVRTTRAVTRLTGSAADNVLAAEASATLNVRIAVGESLEQAVAEIRAAIADPLVEVELLYGSEPSPVSPSEGPEWRRLADTIAEAFPRAVPTPYVMLQASDSRHFTRISDTVYRFLPFDLSAAERAGIHAADESIRVETYLGAIGFWRALLRRS